MTTAVQTSLLDNDRSREAQTRPSSTDVHPWRASILLGLFTVAFGMVYSLFVAPFATQSGGWWISGDAWMPIRAAGFVANGALGYIYQSTPFFVTTPLLPILLAPLAFIQQRFGLLDGYPWPVPHPTMWLVFAPFGLALCGVLYFSLQTLCRELGIERGRLGAQLGGLVLVVLPAAIMWIHYEDVLALAFVLFSLRAVLRRQWSAAALLLGVAVAFKQWAILGLPLLIAASHPGQRRKVLVRTLAVPGLLVALPLAVDWAHASLALIKTRSYPSLSGHRALWVSRAATVVTGTPSRLGTFAVAIAVAWWLRGRSEPDLLLAGFAVIFLSRLLFEPVVFAYYPCPALCLLLLHERLTAGTYRRTILLGGCLLLWFAVRPPPLVWWLVAAGLGALCAGPAALDVWRHRQRATTIDRLS